MKNSDLTRRHFIKGSATVYAAGTTMCAESLNAAQRSQQEVATWQQKVGSRFKVGDADLVLGSVAVKDHRRDTARPSHLRTHSVAMLFVLEGDPAKVADRVQLRQSGDVHELCLTRVVPPQHKSGVFYEAILH